MRILLSWQIGEAGVWWSTAPLQICGGATFLRRLINKQQSFMRLHSTSCVWLVFFLILVCTKSRSGNRTGESPESSFRCLQSWSNTSLNLCTAPMPEIWNWKKGGKQQYGNTKASFECGGENLKSDFEMVPSDEITQKALTFLALTFPQRPSGVLDSGS